jgi:6-phosphogluconolactonase
MKITRRFFALLMVLSAPLTLFSSPRMAGGHASTGQYIAYVGTYTTKTQSKGIYAFRYDANSGKLTPLGVAAETPDPSWVAIHPSGKFLYAANEAGKNSMVSAFAVDARSGKLTLLNQLPALGEDPCYISFDKTGKYVLVANYTSGNVVVFPIGADGKLGAATANVHDEGKLGPNKQRQEAPHAHWIESSARNDFFYVADLGLDRITAYKFDQTRGTMEFGEALYAETNSGIARRSGAALYAPLSPGTGPRHAAFSRNGDLMYVLGELDSTVTGFAKSKEGMFNSIQRISTLPAGFSGRNDAAEIAIHPNGKFLYASNRGHDSIALFHIDPASGKLAVAGDSSVQGKEPRHFAIDPSGNYLLAEDQLSNKIVTFRIDQKTGALTPTGDTVEVPSPVCLTFLAVE